MQPLPSSSIVAARQKACGKARTRWQAAVDSKQWGVRGAMGRGATEPGAEGRGAEGQRGGSVSSSRLEDAHHLVLAQTPNIALKAMRDDLAGGSRRRA
jgi:hypothetical protein